jgi:hypothetical protein
LARQCEERKKEAALREKTTQRRVFVLIIIFASSKYVRIKSQSRQSNYLHLAALFLFYLLFAAFHAAPCKGDLRQMKKRREIGGDWKNEKFLLITTLIMDWKLNDFSFSSNRFSFTSSMCVSLPKRFAFDLYAQVLRLLFIRSYI